MKYTGEILLASIPMPITEWMRQDPVFLSFLPELEERYDGVQRWKTFKLGSRNYFKETDLDHVSGICWDFGSRWYDERRELLDDNGWLRYWGLVPTHDTGEFKGGDIPKSANGMSTEQIRAKKEKQRTFGVAYLKEKLSGSTFFSNASLWFDTFEKISGGVSEIRKCEDPAILLVRLSDVLDGDLTAFREFTGVNVIQDFQIARRFVREGHDELEALVNRLETLYVAKQQYDNARYIRRVYVEQMQKCESLWLERNTRDKQADKSELSWLPDY
jgi:hypothetical protein